MSVGVVDIYCWDSLPVYPNELRNKTCDNIQLGIITPDERHGLYEITTAASHPHYLHHQAC